MNRRGFFAAIVGVAAAASLGIPVKTEEEKPKPKDFDFGWHIQPLRITKNLGREEMLELGRKQPYHRFVSYPIHV